MHVLVTGHRGYIGPILVSLLQERGHSVAGLDSDWFAECAFSDQMPDIPELRKDIRDVTAADLRGFDAVMHLAAISNDPIGNLNPELTYAINHKGSVRLAELAREAGVRRFLFSSSCSTYGAAGDSILTEEATFNPVTPYAHSKVLVEQDVAKLATDTFSPVFLRNATAYGLSPRLRFDLVLNNLVAHAITTGLVYMLSDGTPWRPIVHIEDISRAFVAALEAPQEAVHNQAFNVGINEENYQVRELAEIVAEVVPSCRIEYAPGASPDKRSYRVNFNKIKTSLPAFKPQWNARKGAEQLYQAYNEFHLKKDDFDGPRFRRIDHIKMLLSTGRLGADLRWAKRTPCCRFCGAPLRHTLVDLGMSPLCESYVSADKINQMEPFYPLHVYVCEKCYLVQLEEYVSREDIFTEYAYFSSYAVSWLQHVERYTHQMIERFQLNESSFVVEVASNDGYLLQYFVQAGIPCLGIEPAANVAKAAEEKGVPTLVEFFGVPLAQRMVAEGKQADLIAGNNVLAQVPDLNDFVEGLKLALKPGGVVTIEFPHLMRLMAENQFDTIYHEHFSYFSFISAEKIFAAHGLILFDVEELPTHGGSLRIYARHVDDATKPVSARALELHEREMKAGFADMATYASFGEQVQETKRKLLSFLIQARREGKKVVGYGAPGKGNTLLNYCGIRTDFLDFTVDRNPYKQGKFLPGTHIPIFHPDKIAEERPDYVLILPWNFKDEIMQQMACIREWGGKFVVPIPEVKVFA